MNEQWTAVEHYRLHCAEEWPDSPYKTAMIAAIRARLESLARAAGAAGVQWRCMTCAANRKRTTSILTARMAA